MPVGKLPAELLAALLALAPVSDPRLVLGPGIGVDCAVIDYGSRMLVFKSDPITFASDEIGWYAVQVNANDIVTTGAEPRWFLMTLLLPQGKSTAEQVEVISKQVFAACREMGVDVIGGHSEITYGLDRPILVGTLIGEVERDRLVTPRGIKPGDRVLLTKGVPIEATAILARERPERLRGALSEAELVEAQAFLRQPGISVRREARAAMQAGRVTGMHDPTEGGLLTALWEMAEASQSTLIFDPQAVPVPPLSSRICQVFGIDPLAAIASGALLLTAPPDDANAIQATLEAQGMRCTQIGEVQAGAPAVWQQTGAGKQPARRPERDEIARVFED
ncbi:MAG TPA: AIR synthase family protein [Anaerolineales bacterium]|nr:AIR synthase family protein [Anaerolineales bacterium]